MALTEITKVTGPGIHTLSNILSHNINSSGIITATEFDGKFSGNIVGTAATFSGNVTIGGTLTYEDVTNIDSVGIITGKGADINGDLDVDGHTNLDNVSIAGVTTSQTINFATNTRANFASNNRLSIHSNGTNSYLDYAGTLNVRASSGSSSALSFASNGNVNIVNDLDVDGHTNLDNVNVVGVVTASTGFRVPDGNYNTNLIGIGNHEDFIIYHDTAHTYAENKVGDFRLKADTIKIQSRTGVENFIQATYNGSVELFYNGSKKFETTHMGGVLSGILTATTFDGNLSGGTVAGSTGTFTGDVSIADKIVHTGDTNTSIRFPSADTITFETAGSERARFTKDGNLFVGSNVSQFYPYDSFTNDALFMVNGNLPTINGAGQATILTKAAYNASDRRALLSFGGNYQTTSIGSQTFLAGIGGEKENTTNSNFAGALMLYTRPHGGNETERLRITSAGKVLIGHTSPIEIGVGAGYQMPLQVIGTTYDTSGMVVARYQNNDGGPTVSFVKSRNGTKGAQTIVQANDNLGMIRFLGSDGTDTQNAAARIRAFCDGNPASNKIPGRITFETTDTLTYARERMRIDSSGRVVIGGPGSNAGGSNTYVGGGALAVLGTPYTPNTYACFAMGRVGANVTANTTITNIRLNGGTLGTGRGAEINAAADANWSDASSHPTRLTFHTVASSSTSATERLRIKSDGNITISNTATSPTGDFRMLTLIARSDKQASIGFAQASGVYSGATATAGYSFRLAGDGALELSTHNSNFVAFKATQTGNVESVGIVTAKNFNPVDVQLSHRNMVINGDMRVNQRGDALNQGNAGTYKFSCDRFNLGINGPYMDIAQDAPAAGSNTHPNGFRHSYKLTTRTPVGSVAVGNLISIGYKFEGYQVARLGYGSGALYNNPKSFTISFWAKSSLTGTFAMNWSRDGRIINRQFTISSANTWEYFKATIPPDTSIVGQHENATAMSMTWMISGGTNYTGGAALSTWINHHVAHTGYGMNMNHITTTNATFQITGVQLEEGTVATPFEFIDYATQFQLCRRYYAEFQPTGQEQIYIETGNNNTHSFWNAPIPPGMRATPTAILNGTWTGGGMVGGRSISQVALQSLDNRNAEGAFGRASFRITRSGSAYSDGEVKHTDAWAGGNAYIGYDAEL